MTKFKVSLWSTELETNDGSGLSFLEEKSLGRRYRPCSEDLEGCPHSF